MGDLFLADKAKPVVRKIAVDPDVVVTDQLAQNYLDKRKVAQSFSAAAGSYDGVAELQRQIGQRLLDYMKAQPSTDQLVSASAQWLDIGSGTGYFSHALADDYAEVSVTGIDIAEGMLTFARAHRAKENLTWLCGDAEALPIAGASVDLAFSSLAIQWCQNPQALFGEIARVLKPGGKFYFATLGPRTLYELKAAWQQVDDKVHVNRFIPWSELEPAAQRGFQQQQVDAQLALVEHYFPVLAYQKVSELTHELKTLGAHNVNQGKGSGLTGRRRFKALIEGYEMFRQPNGHLPATYEVYLGCVTKQ